MTGSDVIWEWFWSIIWPYYCIFHFLYSILNVDSKQSYPHLFDALCSVYSKMMTSFLECCTNNVRLRRFILIVEIELFNIRPYCRFSGLLEKYFVTVIPSANCLESCPRKHKPKCTECSWLTTFSWFFCYSVQFVEEFRCCTKTTKRSKKVPDFAKRYTQTRSKHLIYYFKLINIIYA